MKYFKFYLLFSLMFVFMLLPSAVKASSFSISASSYNVAVGSKVTIYIKGSDVTGRFNISSSDNNIFTGGDSKWIENDTVTVTFTAKKAGRVNIIVTPATGISNTNGEIIQLSSKSIQLNSYIPRALSSDNYLSNLSVDGLDLVPSFDKDTTNYIIDLEPGTTSINVNAEKANRYASVSGTGIIEVKEGSNDIDIVVTAENGSKKIYRITAVVKEFDPIKVTIDGSDFTVVRKSSELVKPDYYQETLVKIGEDTIPGFYSEKTGYTLIGLKDVTGSVKLYVYNNGYEPYVSLEFNRMNLIVLESDVNKLPQGFVKDTITINNENIICYKNSELGVTLLYGKSIITGETSFYEFENTDFTIQKFNISAYDKLNEKITLYSCVIIGLGGITLLILFSLIVSIISNKRKLKSKKNEIEKTMNIDINRIQKEAKKDKKIDKLRKQQEKELKKAEHEKKKLEEKMKNKQLKEEKKVKNIQKDDNMFYL